jgi:preprotein translocase subunit YajC
MNPAFDIMGFAPIIIIFVIFYFLILRPQQKKAKEHQQTLNALRRGDRVATVGGLMGTITKIVSDQEVQLEIDDSVKVRLLRAAITEVLSKTEPVSAEPLVSSTETAEEKPAKKTATAKKTKGTTASKAKKK